LLLFRAIMLGAKGDGGRLLGRTAGGSVFGIRRWIQRMLDGQADSDRAGVCSTDQAQYFQCAKPRAEVKLAICQTDPLPKGSVHYVGKLDPPVPAESLRFSDR
jgi:hypothetical protein